MNHTWTYFHSHPIRPGSSKREVINHRAINNQYFSSNVYRVRFKCLVKTNLRPVRWWTAPFLPCPSPPRPAHPCPSGEYISRPGTDVNSLPDPSRNLAFGWQGRAKVKERKWLPHVEAILYARVCLEKRLEEKNRESALNCHRLRNSYELILSIHSLLIKKKIFSHENVSSCNFLHISSNKIFKYSLMFLLR